MTKTMINNNYRKNIETTEVIKSKYTEKQIEIAFVIFSGRINPAIHLKYFSAAQELYKGELKGTLEGGKGNLSVNEHYRKAEEILKYLLLTRGTTKQ